MTALLVIAVAALGVALVVVASYAIHEHAEARRLARENLNLRLLTRDQNGLIRRQNAELAVAAEIVRKWAGRRPR